MFSARVAAGIAARAGSCGRWCELAQPFICVHLLLHHCTLQCVSALSVRRRSGSTVYRHDNSNELRTVPNGIPAVYCLAPQCQRDRRQRRSDLAEYGRSLRTSHAVRVGASCAALSFYPCRNSIKYFLTGS